ncbi:unnamed protein product, partial [Prorocentrum cordatum]
DDHFSSAPTCRPVGDGTASAGGQQLGAPWAPLPGLRQLRGQLRLARRGRRA